ncbi:hypothetical protein DFH07DRAFT_776340 [Mycena maculata]|uniref:Uncharacterized protein n=1 Tax=Mycena maculata TaxID=230809 RepID=A0AAD7N4P5_9AGAR|nr:hypothetical protein DFH07DRAFT_776340 [Mycena maculata]
MSLASKTMRSWAIRYLFAALEFSCPEDFHTWLDIHRRTPELAGIAKRVTFSSSRQFRSLPPRRGLLQGPDKHLDPDPSSMPLMPNVRSFTWASYRTCDMAVSRLSLFPNITELHLSVSFGFDSLSKLLGVCGRLRVLSLDEVDEDPVSLNGRMDRQSSLFDLTALEKLTIRCTESASYVDLFDHSPPLQLKFLAFGDLPRALPWYYSCSIAVIEKLLRLGADSLEELVLDPSFGGDGLRAVEMFHHLPPFAALRSLKLTITPYGDATDARTLINVWPSAPNLTECTLRIQFDESDEDVEAFGDPSTWAGVVKDLFLREFPRFQKLVFHFSAPRRSEFHRIRYRRNQLEKCIREKVVSPVGQCQLSLQWFECGRDGRDTPIIYDAKYGFPVGYRYSNIYEAVRRKSTRASVHIPFIGNHHTICGSGLSGSSEDGFRTDSVTRRFSPFLRVSLLFLISSQPSFLPRVAHCPTSHRIETTDAPRKPQVPVFVGATSTKRKRIRDSFPVSDGTAPPAPKRPRLDLPFTPRGNIFLSGKAKFVPPSPHFVATSDDEDEVEEASDTSFSIVRTTTPTASNPIPCLQLPSTPRGQICRSGKGKVKIRSPQFVPDSENEAPSPNAQTSTAQVEDASSSRLSVRRR